MNPIRVAVLGLGAWGECHVQALQSLPQATITAVYDAAPQRTAQIAARYDVPAVENLETLWARDDVDLVIVATPEAHHFEAVTRALETGKHVLVEKPVSASPDQARAMQSAANAAQRFLVPGHILRFDPRYASIKTHIEQGRIGRIVSIFSKRARPQQQLAVHGRAHTAFVLMAHDIDLALWWVGERVTRVRSHALCVSEAQRVTAGEAPDVLWATLEFANGALATLQSSWLLPAAAHIEMADSAEIIGERGMLHAQTNDGGFSWWSDEAQSAGRHSPDLGIHHQFAGRATGALSTQLAYLCDCIAGEKTPAHVSFADAVHGIEIADAIVRSTRQGREISIED